MTERIPEPDAGLIAHLLACADRDGRDSSTAHLLRCAAERIEIVYDRAPRWQPTEIAPKDGRVLLFRRAYFTTSWNLTFGFWHVGQNVPGWQSQEGGAMLPESWPEWMHIDFLLPEHVVQWLHPDRVGCGEKL